jgi:nitroimidazol reductase NimA-like FMN-containing flavoprotein (pyridoxamine 5'-phosphate oxidase superfamily)
MLRCGHPLTTQDPLNQKEKSMSTELDSLEAREHLFQGELVEMPRPECLKKLAATRVGRVAYNSEEGPVVVPVNGRVIDTDVFLRTRAGSPLALALRDTKASYEVDGFDQFEQAGWSVLVQGDASWAEATELPAYPSEWPVPWAAGPRLTYIRIRATHVSGRILRP